MFLHKEVIKKYFEIVVCHAHGEYHWDLYYARGIGFSTYLMAFGKSPDQEEAIGIAKEYANRLAHKYRFLNRKKHGTT